MRAAHVPIAVLLFHHAIYQSVFSQTQTLEDHIVLHTAQTQTQTLETPEVFHITALVPSAVLLFPVLAVNADHPTAVLYAATVFVWRAFVPIAVLRNPAVVFCIDP